MDTFFGLSSTGWTAISALGIVAALAVAAVSAFLAFRQLGEMRRVREERARPYVVVDVEPSPASRNLLDLVVRNIGETPAVDTTIDLDPAPVRANEEAQYPLAEVRMLAEPIALLAPGREMRVFFDSLIDRKDREDLPTVHRATVTYRNTVGEQWTDHYTLDLAAGRGAMFVDVLSMHDAAKALRELSSSLKSSPLVRGDVEAVVETPAERRARVEQAKREQQQAHEDLMQRLNRRET